MSESLQAKLDEQFINNETNEPICLADITPDMLLNIEYYYIANADTDVVPIAGPLGVIPEDKVLEQNVLGLKYYTKEPLSNGLVRLIQSKRNKMYIDTKTNEQIEFDNINTNNMHTVLLCLIKRINMNYTSDLEPPTNQVSIDRNNKFLTPQEALCENVAHYNCYTTYPLSEDIKETIHERIIAENAIQKDIDEFVIVPQIPITTTVRLVNKRTWWPGTWY